MERVVKAPQGRNQLIIRYEEDTRIRVVELFLKLTRLFYDSVTIRLISKVQKVNGPLKTPRTQFDPDHIVFPF